MRQSNCLIIKFGGASLATLDHIEKAAEIILGRQKYFSKIVVVASAMGQMTDQLLEMAYGVCEKPENREVDMLVSAGERISASLLSLALIKRGCPALSLTGSQTGIITTSEHCDARIIDVRPIRIPPLLEAGRIVVVAGFQGVSEQKEVTTLGRGGSDTTAVALGVALRAAKVEFYKDVGGIYSNDPKKDKEAKLLSSITYTEAIELFGKTGGSILHPRSIELARLNALPLHVLSFEKESLEKNPKGSWIVENGLNAPKEALFEVYERC
jgi:aspartate kinase